MTIFRNLTIIIILFLFGSLSAQTDSIKDLNYYNRQATDAYHKGDYNAFLENMLEARKIRPNSPAIMYNLACGYSLTGQNEQALDMLEQIALRGIDFGVELDTDFTPLRGTERFANICQSLNKYRETINNSEVAFVVKEPGLIPEGIAYDPINKRFFIGAVNDRKIISVDFNGTAADFTANRQDGLFAVLGMKVDTKNQVLWVCSSTSESMEGYDPDETPKAAVHKYKLSGEFIKKYASPEGEEHEFNDLVVDSKGTVYITDSRTGELFIIDHNKDSLELFSERGNFVSTNGIALSADEKSLLVADYADGIYKVNLADKSVTPLSISSGVSLYGIDGLYFYNNSLLAIQNVIRPNRLVRCYLNNNLDSVTNLEIVEMNNDIFSDPTTGTFVDDNFYYIANSQLGAFDNQTHSFPTDSLKNIVILKTKLK